MRRAILSTKNFNPRLREGGDCLRLLFLNQHLLFQSTPPRGRRHSIITSIFPVRYFNPRLREGGDNAVSASICAACCISIHASAREATVIWRYCNGDPEFQSTPPRGRRRQPVSPSYGCQYISIHASAREATKSTPSGISYSAISIHASAREATELCTLSDNSKKFQSTPPRGRRQALRNVILFHIVISIHASAREATKYLFPSSDHLQISIHASAREATAIIIALHQLGNYFNPRLREGGDEEETGVTVEFRISIHASAREATGHVYHVKMGVCGISIHASAREATENNLDICVKVAISIHASAREATQKSQILRM